MPRTFDPPKRCLVFMPTWLGDCVMATPTLQAMRTLWPDAHIALLISEPIAPLLEGTPGIDQLVTYRKKGDGVLKLARRLSAERFDTAVLLPNSFRAAALAAAAGIKRRVGYERDGRGVLLSDRLVPQKEAGRFLPVPTLEYYLGIARYLGAVDPDPAMRLTATDDDRADAQRVLTEAGYDTDAARPIVLLNPGAQKQTKRWAPDRFGELADRLREVHGVDIAVTGSPSEREVLDAVIAASNGPVLDLPAHGMNLRTLKAVVARSAVMVTNDTGPRHIAAAMDTPVVTLFGPTGPEWTEIHFPKERMVIAPGELDPSGESNRKNPTRHMGLITTDAVYAAAEELLPHAAPAT